VKEAEMIFVAVGTPPKADGNADLQYVRAVAKEIGKTLDHYAVIVNKSTVPVGTGDMVRDLIAAEYTGDFEVCSNPEFLKEGSALDDFVHPDRVIVGIDGDDPRPRQMMEELYSPLRAPIFFTDIKTAELTKYAANTFLAMQISFINTLSDLAEKTGANIVEVAAGMKLDKRIGERAFLSAGIGYGGSCFPKDVEALIAMTKRYDARSELLEQIKQVNQQQRHQIVNKLESMVGGSVLDKTVAIWGLAFKPNTDDIRESAALDIAQLLLDRGATVQAYDPIAGVESQKVLPEGVVVPDLYQTVKGADIVLLATEWAEFQEVDWSQVRQSMNSPRILDGRNLYQRADLEAAGFDYEGVGV
jgi:UDPglucose 6-dehydrogenase